MSAWGEEKKKRGYLVGPQEPNKPSLLDHQRFFSSTSKFGFIDHSQPNDVKFKYKTISGNRQEMTRNLEGGGRVLFRPK